MALWAPLMVNDIEIGIAYVHRTEAFEHGRDEYTYEWEVRFRELDGTTRTTIGTVVHNYSAGALSLLGKVLQLAQVEFTV